MKICIFGAASAQIDRCYVEAVEDLAEKMAKRGHSLVFGAGGSGLMGAAARGTKRGGGYIHGVIPKFFREERLESIYDQCDELTFTDTMAERKTTMEDDCDAFIIVPGGIGTLEEFYEVITLKQLGRHHKAIAFYNLNGYYDTLEKFMHEMSEKKFMAAACHEMYRIFTDAEELFAYLETYVPDVTSARVLKNTN
ncbi:MAG: TIGR00730 family Rossman fold protein [Bacillota bacterium]|uniref:Cytokinin riboside 5'-monophosphate phosphoribohydrolase n=1 Tax=Candidatus Gallimonas intestinavium TaxID=2838603 RepID=A0A9D2G361_9FIRM|nr:MAG: TIGR00730 family Rossman fold protein [Bacillota bacterium]HIZ72209.1 TIGR00730 family Rossman fold protein [Candidatus Gallimonas intestinavium]